MLDLRRRQFLTLLGGAAAWPLAARAQPADRIARVGFFGADRSVPLGATLYQAFTDELQIHGFNSGQNLIVDFRRVEQDLPTLSADAAALVRSNVNVLVTQGTEPALQAALAATRTLPIVMMAANYDPFASGYVKSLARPEGNVTGFSFLELSVLGKSLELLKQIAPAVVRVGLIYNPDNPNTVWFNRSFEVAAGRLAIEPIAMPIHGIAEIANAFANLAGRQDAGVLFPSDITTSLLRHELVPLLAKYLLPAMYSEAFFVKMGGLAFYGADRADLYRRSAGYIDRILRGENASDLPFQQPTKYEFILNLKTAKALGLELSPTLLALADQVIE